MNRLSLSPFLGFLGATLTFTAPALARTPIGNLGTSPGITIQGTVVSVVGNDFLLRDDTSEVIVDAGPRWWQAINVQPGETLTVIGEYDEGELDAFSIVRGSGEVITIRPAYGKPPWAGQKGRDKGNVRD